MSSPERRPAEEQRLQSLARELNSVAIHLTRRLRRSDEALGVSSPRLSALSVLVFGGPCTLGELAAAERVTAPTMSRTVAALEADGLVARQPDPDDGRAVRLEATRRGRRLMLRGRAMREERLVRELAGRGERDLRALERAAAVLRELEAADGGDQEAGRG
jgi:DNA-binding MarR family transcriptional regulator